jgi:DNA-binding transcriptional ArsR family regulator
MGSRGFTMVPNAVLSGKILRPDGRKLSNSAIVLYALILDYSNAGQRLCTASEATLGRHLGVTDRQVRNLLRELKEANLIVVRREGRGITNIIRPLVLPERKSASGHNRNSASGEQDNGSKNEQRNEEEQSSNRDQRGACA